MRIISKTADIEAVARRFRPSVARGLVSLHFCNGSVEKACRNLAGGPDASPVGTPVAEATYLRCNGLSNFLQTAHAETDVGTYYCVARSLDTFATNANRPMFYGTFRNQAVAGGGETFGVSLYATTIGGATGTATRGTTTSDHTPAPAGVIFTSSGWTLFCQRITDLSSSLFNETTGAGGVAESELPRFRSTGLFRIGSGFTQFGGECDVAAWWGYDVVHTDEERAATVADIRLYFARKGLTL